MKDDRGTKGLFFKRPRCIGAERRQNSYANQSTVRTKNMTMLIRNSDYSVFQIIHTA
jgi:hypothetical protein